ncbi:nucleotide-diphospho-sugar transferase [Marasmius fiardii PR-910]|nr:nucleotide-diphospho-sugar transferase [Marasmius fiardii PR-910]
MTQTSRAAFVTLLTRIDYLAGVLVLHHSLKAVASSYPLVVMVTATVNEEVRKILVKQGIQLYDVEPLMPEKSRHTVSESDARFIDTWTKLRWIFSPTQEFVLLDADMIVMKNMDELMDLSLGDGEIAAAHVCACNPRKFPHYPADWIPDNCAHTAVRTPLAPPPTWSPGCPRPYSQLNSGTVVLNPSRNLADEVISYLNTTDLSSFAFPDQDLLSALFKGRWKALSWYYNALKTLRVIHPQEWDDSEVRCLHYILPEKPWKTRDLAPGDPYHEMNSWWWARFVDMTKGLDEKDRELVVSTVAAL